MKAPGDKTVHASASYRLYLHLVWPTKYRKHVLGEKLTPIVESKILEVCRTKPYQLFVVKAAVDHMHVLLGMRPTQAVSAATEAIDFIVQSFVFRSLIQPVVPLSFAVTNRMAM